MAASTRIVVLAVAIAAAAVSSVSAAVVAPTPWPTCGTPRLPITGEPSRDRVLLKVCGTRRVRAGVAYGYTVIVRNAATVPFRTLKLSVLHHEAITRSTRPYAHGTPPKQYRAMAAAVWTRRDLERFGTFQVSFALPFERHTDPAGSSLVVGVDALGTNGVHATAGLAFGITFR
jgi:hypothetical protein